MSQQPKSALVNMLEERDAMLAVRVAEIRAKIERWLTYVPSTFPHYTSHTIDHSDEIVSQLSKLLFNAGETEPVIQLSTSEAFVLVASAYLHDAGMVCSDDEKFRILSSDSWKHWVSDEGTGGKRWAGVCELRLRGDGGDAPFSFLADLQTRYLVAEFVRAQHHIRAGTFICEHPQALGVAGEDAVAVRTIADICIAHGLRRHELDDRERYPDRRDVLGEQVNVRLMAILLRLADLLDLRSDRACPLLSNAANPLPKDSYAHWSQYSRIVHRLTAPDRIEIVAECQVQEEHNLLEDWCKWIVDEVADAPRILMSSRRHAEWKPPMATLLSGRSGSIVIRPSASATYVPSRWSFQLAPDEVMDRLIRDVYSHPAAFLRELVQNGLDACRCQMYLDMKAQGLPTPEYTVEVPEEIRERYGVTVSVVVRKYQSELSGEDEESQVLIVEDNGIGMDHEIIEKYLLQVGRSFYKTDVFRRDFGFQPGSRFGVGFLSVFGASDRVAVDTFRPGSNSGPIQMVLRGPRNTFLTSKGSRVSNGTRVEVTLRQPIADDRVVALIRSWCRRVEMPVRVVTGKGDDVVRAEKSEDLEYETRAAGSGEGFGVRAYPVNVPGVYGEVYVFYWRDKDGVEDWSQKDWAMNVYPETHPEATAPTFPTDLTCIHGISISAYDLAAHSIAGAARIDYRREIDTPTLAREQIANHGRWRMDPVIDAKWREILSAHLESSARATGPEGWKYRQRLVGRFELEEFWEDLPNMLKVYQCGVATGRSIKELLGEREFMVAGRLVDFSWAADREGELKRPPEWLADVPTLCFVIGDLRFLSRRHRRLLYRGRVVTNLEIREGGQCVATWGPPDADSAMLREVAEMDVGIVEMPLSVGVGITGFDIFDEKLTLNSAHPITTWVLNVARNSTGAAPNVTRDQVKRLIDLLFKGLQYPSLDSEKFRTFCAGFGEIKDLPEDLRPPSIDF